MPDDESRLIAETTGRILQSADLTAAATAVEQGAWPQPLWAALDDAGLPLTWVPEDAGGVGAGPAAGFEVVRLLGLHAAPVPLAETLLATRLLALAGVQPPEGPLTLALAPDTARIGASGRLTGHADAVPFARHCETLLVIAADADGQPVLCLLPRAACTLTPGQSIAGEPADRIAFDAKPLATAKGLTWDACRAWGAAIRAMQMAGVLEQVLNLCLTYAQDRVQFGKPIGKFQAIQHALAELAGEVAAASAAADAAARELARSPSVDAAALAEVAAAKIRCGEAASLGAAIAHQVHGAIGTTYEHSLHLYTRRLWAWRDSFGPEAEWSLVLGRAALAGGGAGLWPFAAR